MTEPMFPRPIAHAGFHDPAKGIVANSAAAFAAAIEADYAIECDVQLSSDGVPVIIHDADLMRVLGRGGLVAETSAAEITAMPLLDSAAGDCPQRFTDFLDQVGGRVQLQVELKRQRDAAGTEALARAIAEALKAYQGPATVESFDPALITQIRHFGFTGPRGIVTHDYLETGRPTHLTDEQRYTLQHLLHWHETQFDFISCEKTALELPAITFWRALGKPVTAWTIHSPAEAAAAQPHIDQIVFDGFDPERPEEPIPAGASL